MIDFEDFPDANLTPQQHARFDSLAEAVTNLLNDEAADPNLVLNVLVRVTGNAIGHWTTPDKLDHAVGCIADGIMKQAKAYRTD